MSEHIPDDDRHEQGQAIPHEGTAIVLPPAEGRAADPFEGRWKTLAEWGEGEDWLSKAPPPRRWLLDRPSTETNGRANPHGVLPLGKTGMLVAAGGVGKTMVSVQLAMAVATGRPWLEHFGTPNPGHVLLALAEEDAEEIRRRMYNVACAMRLTSAQQRLAYERIVAVPLAGKSVALTESDGRNTTESATLHYLRKRLDEGSREWRLIMLDPLSRFAGCDTEKDNNAATLFVAAIESLASSKGGPTVLLAHHTNKVSRSPEAEATAAAARGASGLTDGVRWVANLAPVGSEDDDLVKLSVTKTNYALRCPALTLVRDTDHGGALRAEKPAERELRKGDGNGKAASKAERLGDI
jgi:hypothetical protein